MSDKPIQIEPLNLVTLAWTDRGEGSMLIAEKINEIIDLLNKFNKDNTTRVVQMDDAIKDISDER